MYVLRDNYAVPTLVLLRKSKQLHNGDPKIPDGRLASTQLCHNKDGATFHDMLIINSAKHYMPERILVDTVYLFAYYHIYKKIRLKMNVLVPGFYSIR